MEQKIIEAYIKYILDNGEQPKSVYAFAHSIQITESDFYRYFGSFDAVEKSIALQLLDDTVRQLEGDEVYLGYSAREKMMAFFYAWVEKARDIRSFLVNITKKQYNPVPHYLDAVKDDFKKHARDIVREGINKQEIADRRLITGRYADALWLQFIYIHNFWLKDDSRNFEKTDAAIDKSVKLAFELMGQSVLDAAFDFGKFLFQNRK